MLHLKKSTLVNHGDIKVTPKKFWWKYWRQDKVDLIRSLYVKSQSIALSSNSAFWWAPPPQTDWVIFEPASAHHLGLEAQNLENPILTFACSSLKALHDSFKLQRLLQVVRFLFMSFFTHTSIVFLFRHLTTEIVIFIHVCCQTRYFVGDSFSFI